MSLNNLANLTRIKAVMRKPSNIYCVPWQSTKKVLGPDHPDVAMGSII